MSDSELYKYLEEELNIILDEKQKAELAFYNSYLLEYNQKVNITAIKEYEDVNLKHFLDSLTLVKVANLKENLSVLDVGSGGGFPGIVLKIVFPNLQVTLLDSNHKKSDFQKSVIEKLGLRDIFVVNMRAEDYVKKGNVFDIVVARAVASLPILSELCIPFVRINGVFLAMKAHSGDELNESMMAINFLGGKFLNTETFLLPNNVGVREIIKIKKVKESPDGYPRVYDKILKKTLKTLKK